MMTILLTKARMDAKDAWFGSEQSQGYAIISQDSYQSDTAESTYFVFFIPNYFSTYLTSDIMF